MHETGQGTGPSILHTSREPRLINLPYPADNRSWPFESLCPANTPDPSQITPGFICLCPAEALQRGNAPGDCAKLKTPISRFVRPLSSGGFEIELHAALAANVARPRRGIQNVCIWIHTAKRGANC